ncbi:MAG: hypothetical protein HY304_02360 [candidate division Zixibacteria bacterium]|nr:hypothetical protein [candidate division Zixibacteria bacterium]
MLSNMKKRTLEKANFCIEIDFDRHTEDPGRVFRSMSELIDAFQALDRDLVNTVDSKIEPVLLQEDVKT